MRRLLALPLTAVLLGGCSGAPSADPTPTSTPPKPRPTPTVPPPDKLLPIKITFWGKRPLKWPEMIGPDTSGGISLEQAMLRYMADQTVLMAGYKAKVKCPGGGPLDVYSTFWTTFNTEGDDLRCDLIPALRLVQLNHLGCHRQAISRESGSVT